MHILRQALRLEHEQNDLTAESEIQRSSFAIYPFLLRSSFVLPSFILRLLSIDCPSIVHRLSIVMMEKQWRIFGESMVLNRRMNEGRSKAERRIKYEKQKERIISN